MLAVPVNRQALLLGRVAIRAALRAGVVVPDVARFDAKASWAIAERPRRFNVSSHSIESCCIYADRVRKVNRDFGLRAQRHSHALAPGDSVDRTKQFRLRCRVGIEPGPADRRGQVSPRFRVDDHELRRDLVNIAGERCRQIAEVLHMPIGRHGVGKDDRVISPDDRAGPKLIYDPSDSVHRSRRTRYRPLDRVSIAGDRVLKVERKTFPSNFLNGRHERPRVLRPKHNPVNVLAGERYKKRPPAHWILDPAEARVEPIEEPATVERRNVGLVARGNDHGGRMIADICLRVKLWLGGSSWWLSSRVSWKRIEPIEASIGSEQSPAGSLGRRLYGRSSAELHPLKTA